MGDTLSALESQNTAFEVVTAMDTCVLDIRHHDVII